MNEINVLMNKKINKTCFCSRGPQVHMGAQESQDHTGQRYTALFFFLIIIFTFVVIVRDWYIS